MREHIQDLYRELQVAPLVSNGAGKKLCAETKAQKTKIETPEFPLSKDVCPEQKEISLSGEYAKEDPPCIEASLPVPSFSALPNLTGASVVPESLGLNQVPTTAQTLKHPLEESPPFAKEVLNYRELQLKSNREELRPCEKLQQNGSKSLSNVELLCLLLGSGNRQLSVEQIARQVYRQLAREPFASSLESLQSIKGMGLGKSCSILAALELARRLLSPGIKPKQLNSPEAIHQQIAHFADQQENLVAINLNGACEALSVRLITRGTINRSLIHPREVFTHAIREQAHSVVIAHNHPSGNLEPSNEDIQSTKRLQEAAQVLGVKLLDHIVFCHNSYLSFAEQGLLQSESCSQRST